MVALMVAHEALARCVEVEIMRIGWAGNHVERTRPVVAVAAIVFESVLLAVARSGQEETVAVSGGEQATVHAVQLCPGDGRVVFEFLKLCLGGHAPVAAPVGHGCVVTWFL